MSSLMYPCTAYGPVSLWREMMSQRWRPGLGTDKNEAAPAKAALSLGRASKNGRIPSDNWRLTYCVYKGNLKGLRVCGAGVDMERD
jgi:hypothetical protein